MQITVRYSSIDGYTETRHYKTLKMAHRWANEMVGDCFEIGTGYAIDGYGIGKIQSNISLEQLLTKPKELNPCLCGAPDLDSNHNCTVLCTCQVTGRQASCGGYDCRMALEEEMRAEAEFVRRYPGIL